MPYTVNELDVLNAIELKQLPISVQHWTWPYEVEYREGLQEDIENGVTDEYGFVYSADGKRLLQANSCESYRIPEGVETIERTAFVNSFCEKLHVPYTCNFDQQNLILGREWSDTLIQQWDSPYAETVRITDSLFFDDDELKVDEQHQVVYSADGTHLLNCLTTFNLTELHIPDGVTTICDDAFFARANSSQPLLLYGPHSLQVIGADIFGDGGGRILYC